MRPNSCKVLTVVSTNVPHAAVMASLAADLHKTLGEVRLLMTWRAMEVAKQGQRALLLQKASSTQQPSIEFDNVAIACDFKPVVEVFLQGEEVNIPSLCFYCDAGIYKARQTFLTSSP